MKIVLFSFFSGIGLLDLGFEDEGFAIAFVNEIFPPFLSAYRFARTGRPEPFFGFDNSSAAEFLEGKQRDHLAGMIDKARHEGNIIGFIGGPPCPDFSVGGKNRGRNGENGMLSQVYCDLMKHFRPDFFLFENVKGLWKTACHRAFYDELKMALQFAGYLTADRLLNAIQYGAPQNRERIILFGVINQAVSDLKLRTITSKDCSFSPSLGIDWDKYTVYNHAVRSRYAWPTTSQFQVDSVLPPPEDVPLDLTTQYWFAKNNVTGHPNAEHYFKPRQALTRFLSIEEGDDSRKSFKRLHRWRYSPTAAYGHNEVHLHPYKARRLSVAESLAIQSVPSSFSLPPTMTLTDMFQGVGNGVPYLLSRSVARTITEFFSGKQSSGAVGQKTQPLAEVGTRTLKST